MPLGDGGQLTIDPTSQFGLSYKATSAAASTIKAPYVWDNYMSADGGVVITGINFNIGGKAYFTRNGTAWGCHTFFAAATYPRTMRCRLWRNGVSVAIHSQTINSAGYYDCLFDAPYYVSDPRQMPYTCSIFDASLADGGVGGVASLDYWHGAARPGALTQSYFTYNELGGTIMPLQSYYSSGGDVEPNQASGVIFVDMIFTSPLP